MDGVGQAGDVLLALLDNRESENGKVGADDAAADRLALALAGAAGAVAGVAVGEEEADTVGGNDTLLHRETLLVVAAGDADDVALPLIAKGVGRDLSAHLVHPSQHVCEESAVIDRTYALPVAIWLAQHARIEKQQCNILEEVPELALILHIDQLLRAVRGMRNVQLESVSTVVELENTRKRAFRDRKIMPFIESREISGIRTFMLAVFAERLSLMLQTETGNRRKVLCAVPDREKS